jgi:hypothetical protein
MLQRGHDQLGSACLSNGANGQIKNMTAACQTGRIGYIEVNSTETMPRKRPALCLSLGSTAARGGEVSFIAILGTGA